MDQALSKELYSDLSADGFEPLFESPACPDHNRLTSAADAGSNTRSGAGTTSKVSPKVDVSSDSSSWTLRAASEILELSPNTIRKRIRTGQLRAYKILGLNGPEWRIQPPVYSTGATGMADVVGTTAGTGVAIAAGIDPATIDTLLKLIETQAKQLEIAATQLSASTEHVKAATRVIAYQQIQLEEKDSRVKLLTDSRHHDWWLVKLVRRLRLF